MSISGSQERGERESYFKSVMEGFPPSPGHIASGDHRAVAAQETPGRRREEAASTSAGKGGTHDPCQSFLWLFRSRKSLCPFSSCPDRLPFWKAQQQLAVATMHGKGTVPADSAAPRSAGAKISTEAKGVSRQGTQAACQERQEESEQTPLPEARRVGTQ